MADKYSADDLKDMLSKGHAMKNENGDPSYPVADAEDLGKAIKAVGRGGADHDKIRKHIMDRAAALGLSKDIPDNWNADGSLADAEEKSRQFAPDTLEARAEESMSFGNIQSLVYAALVASLPFGQTDIWIQDCAPDWVVWHSYGPGASGDFKVGYTLDGDTVTFSGPPVEVAEVTTYAVVGEGQTLSGDPAGETRADDLVNCPTCDGTGKIMEGNRDCPDCTDGKVTPEKAEELKSAATSASHRRRRARRTLERHQERRTYTATMELRSATTSGDDLVLAGTPIAYKAPYMVRDMVGPFRETMHPGVADDVLKRGADTRFLFNHDGLPLGRTTSGTLVLTDSDEGLRAEVHMDARQSVANDLAIAVERGDVTQMSCGFIVAEDGDEWRMGADGTEERDVFAFDELFDVSAVTYPASPTTSIEMAQRALLGISEDSRERLRRLWVLAKDIREGKVLSQQNGQALMEALEALHEADDIDIPGIVRSLQTIDTALDAGQAGIAAVLGTSNPDGGSGDEEPTLAPATDAKRELQRQRLRLIRTRDLLVAS